ncbi:class II aldolase/adducin family protein [Actinocorallia sp. A-T 12471]|uniref:class II aldolase/adducin family protein n=1 Tax=Actinocorallia sp. A-T 12471 TaxID=3089813 RepID=UPI0029CB6D27|nr:class II aldolase/adducin family protein [Actinocorallia sp. A-T 12471]MDX6740888.1 class II aldolase/adducin family protein [Actinocorallia sp. A-T 12471]
MTARASARADVAAASRRLAQEGLLIGTAGNVSLAFAGPDGPEAAITATGVVLADITPDQVTVVGLDGRVREGDLAPTSEADLHLALLRERGGAVVHTHSPAATALSLVLDELPCVHYQQLTIGGSVRVAPFAVFGSRELADAVSAALAGKQAAILANHGTVAVGGDLAKAVENALLLEWAADLYTRASALGTPRALTEEQQLAVIEAALATGYGTTKAAER